MKSFTESAPSYQPLVTSSVLNAGVLPAPGSMLGAFGVFTPTVTLAGRPAGSGVVMSEGAVMSETGSTVLYFDTTSALKGEP